MKRVGFSVLEETSVLGRFCHIRVPDGDGKPSSVFRKLRTGSISEYRRLDEVFWRSLKHGFSLPHHRLIEDADDNPWLEVEYLNSCSGDTIIESDVSVRDEFLERYGDVLDSILSMPEEPFNADPKLEQYVYDDEFYLCDLEPRVSYLDENPVLESIANHRVARTSYQYVSAIIDLYEKGNVGNACADTAVSITEKVLEQPSYFKGCPTYNEFDSLRDDLTRRGL